SYAPYFGLSVERWRKPDPKTHSIGKDRDLIPTDWPVTLPPNMSKHEAKTHDFTPDGAQANLQDHLERLAKDPQDVRLLAEIGTLYFTLSNYPAAEEAYQKFFNSDLNDSSFLNAAVWSYGEMLPGTNFELAYKAVARAQALSPHDAFIADTAGWML